MIHNQLIAINKILNVDHIRSPKSFELLNKSLSEQIFWRSASNDTIACPEESQVIHSKRKQYMHKRD